MAARLVAGGPAPPAARRERRDDPRRVADGTGGALAAWIGVRPAMFVGAIIGFTSVLPIVLSPLRSLREFPELEPPPLLHEEGVVTALGGPAAADA